MSVRRPPCDQSPLTDPATVTEMWCALLRWEPIRFRTLWLMFLDPEWCPAGPLVTVDDLADGPYDLATADLVALCREIIEGPGGGGSVVMLLARPGGPPWTVSDRAWGRFLLLAAAQLSEPAWPVHIARDRHLERFVLPVPC